MKRQWMANGRGGVEQDRLEAAGPSRVDSSHNDSKGVQEYASRKRSKRSRSPSLQPLAPARSAILSLEGSLSEEILLRCLSYLDIDDLMQVSRVSTAWHRLSHDPHLWKRLYMSTFATGRSQRFLVPSSSHRATMTPTRPWRELYKISVNWRRGNARTSTITRAMRESVLAPAPGDLAVEGEQTPARRQTASTVRPNRTSARHQRAQARPTDTIVQFHGQVFFTASRSQVGGVPTVAVHKSMPSGADSAQIGTISSPSIAAYLTAEGAQAYQMSITEMRLDEAGQSSDTRHPLVLAVFYSTGQYSIFAANLEPETRAFSWKEEYCSLAISPLSRLTLSFDPIVLARVHSPLIVTCSSAFTIRFLRIRHVLGDAKQSATVVEEVAPTLHSSETWEPVSLTVKETTKRVGARSRQSLVSVPADVEERSFKVTLAYSTPVWPDGWTVGVQEFSLTLPEDSRRRCTFDSLHAIAPLATRPSVGSGSLRRPLDLVTAIEHSDPFVVTSRADNTIQVYETVHHQRASTRRQGQVANSAGTRALSLVHRRTLFGHTSGVTSVAVQAETGTCVSTAKDGQVKVWQLRPAVQDKGRDEQGALVASVDVVDTDFKETDEGGVHGSRRGRKLNIWDEMKALRRRKKRRQKHAAMQSRLQVDPDNATDELQGFARQVWFDEDKIRLAWCSAAVLLASAPAGTSAFAEGTISDRDYSLQLDEGFLHRVPTTMPGLANNLGWRYQLDCVTSQSGNPIFAFCGGRQRDESGAAYGATYDFTSHVCPNTSGCSVSAQPVAPERMYGDGPSSGSTSTSAAAAPVATNDSQASGEADSSGNGNDESDGSYRDHGDEGMHMSDAPSSATKAAAAPVGPATRTVRGSFAYPTALPNSALSNSIQVPKTTLRLATFGLGFAGFIALAVL
ncbi:hypothetical protein OIV83_002311 [Microbotryomycetes sp. JL201]|nr:hypothetical protein OIV83_002311 [Microbotryomycetes sp. JL201]